MASEGSVVVRARDRTGRMNEELCRTFVKEAVAIANFEGTPTFHQLSIEAGNQLLALDKTLCYGWRWVCNVKGQCGYVPATAIRDISAPGRRKTEESKNKNEVLKDGEASESHSPVQQSIVPCSQADEATTQEIGPFRRVAVCKDPKVVSAYERYKNWQGLKLFHGNNDASPKHTQTPVSNSSSAGRAIGFSAPHRVLHPMDAHDSEISAFNGVGFSTCTEQNRRTTEFCQHHEGHNETGHSKPALNTFSRPASSPARNVVRDMEGLVLRLKTLYRPNQDRAALPYTNKLVQGETYEGFHVERQGQARHPYFPMTFGNVGVSENEVRTPEVERQVVLASDPFQKLRHLIADMEAASGSMHEPKTCAKSGIEASEPAAQDQYSRLSPQFRSMAFLR